LYLFHIIKFEGKINANEGQKLKWIDKDPTITIINEEYLEPNRKLMKELLLIDII